MIVVTRGEYDDDGWLFSVDATKEEVVEVAKAWNAEAKSLRETMRQAWDAAASAANAVAGDIHDQSDHNETDRRERVARWERAYYQYLADHSTPCVDACADDVRAFFSARLKVVPVEEVNIDCVE